MPGLLKSINDSEKISRALRLVSHSAVAASVIAAGLVALYTVRVSALYLLYAAVILLLPFLLVTLLRRLINAPRPYELYDFYKVAPKNKSGRSFPSRHAHSAFAIGTLLTFFSVPLGTLMLFLALSLSVARVLLGIHFIRDVIAGALTGIGSSVIGILIFF